MFSQIKLALLGLGALAVVTAIGFGYMHYRNVLSERDAALAARDQLTIANAELSQGLESYKAQAEAASQAMSEMADTANAANDEVERLNALFREHDLETLAKKKPGLIERRINRGTARVFGMFETETAAGPGSD